MTLKRHIFDVYVAPLDADLEHPDFDAEPLEFLAVNVIQGDMVRAELEGSKQGLPAADKAAMTATTLWVWATLNRTGDLDCKWSEFRGRCVAVQAVKGGERDVDPTQPAAPSGSPSSSLEPSAADLPTG